VKQLRKEVAELLRQDKQGNARIRCALCCFPLAVMPLLGEHHPTPEFPSFVSPTAAAHTASYSHLHPAHPPTQPTHPPAAAAGLSL
jgi:hypothetical protein